MLTLNHNYFQVTPNSKNGKESQPFRKRQFLFGLLVLFLVDILWVASSELTKYVYIEKKIERPFLLTHLRSSMLLLYLCYVLCFTPSQRDPVRTSPDYTQLLEPTTETEDENYFTESTTSLGDSTFVPVRAGETTDSDDAAPRAVRFNKVAEVRVMSAAQAGEALLARLSWAASVRATEHAQRRAAAAATRRHVRLALTICVPWFGANYLYRLSLQNTTVSSATMYTSTTSAFALTLCAIFAQVPNDRFNLAKIVAVLFTAAGLVAIGTSDSHNSNWAAVLSALAAALFYAVHLMMIRRELRKGETINPPLLAGLVGCACVILMWTFGLILSLTNVEHAELPSPKLWTWLFIDAALGPVLSEALWLWGISLTSSQQVATGSLGLTIPLSLCVDAYRGQGGGLVRWLGAVFAAVGWIAAATGDDAHLHSFLAWLRQRLCRGHGFTPLRNLSELEEQSEALMSTDEPT